MSFVFLKSENKVQCLLTHSMKDIFQVTKCMDRPYILSPKLNFEFVRINNLQNFIDTEIGL